MESWKQQAKARDKQLQPAEDKSQHSRPAQLDPIQSIANVLNSHHRGQQRANLLPASAEKNAITSGPKGDNQTEVEQPAAKGSPSSSQDSDGSSISNSNISPGQVDQGNSYLYAYNDFVSAKFDPGRRNLAALCPTKQQHQQRALLCGHRQPEPRAHESLIESDEDDNLSYILHQNRPHHDQLVRHQVRCPSALSAISQPAQRDKDQLQAHGIDHHLACARRSHPRHICGIAGGSGQAAARFAQSAGDIASRLREQSQQAFLLNQPKPKAKRHLTCQHFISDDITAVQSHKFAAHDLARYLSAAPEPLASDANEHFVSPDNHRDVAGEQLANQPAGSTGSLIADISASETDARAAYLLRKPAPDRRRAGGLIGWLLYSAAAIFSAPPAERLGGQSQCGQQPRGKRHRRAKGAKRRADLAYLDMYSSTQQLGAVGQIGGQAGAYYAAEQPLGRPYAGHQLQHQQHQHQHQQPHQYPVSGSDSSLGSSAFASSAVRMGALFRSCCSKRCLLVGCLLLIAFIFLTVIALSAYLNFLINLSKSHLTPLSGRLRVESAGDSFVEALANRSSREFLAKQAQYETVLRGALDRAQGSLRTFPNHLVKLEVYAFKPGSLWVYFRLFVNRRSLLLDEPLMRRKSADEPLERLFLARLTQQALQSGFEQLLAARPARQPRASPAPASVSSFDEQLGRLMALVEAVDLLSIQVAQEFDLLQSLGLAGQPPPPSVSDNLRASTPDASTPASRSPADDEQRPPAAAAPATLEATRGSGELSAGAKKFTLYGYKENSTRPAQTRAQDSLFLVNLQRKPAAAATTRAPKNDNRQSNTVKEIVSARPHSEPTGQHSQQQQQQQHQLHSSTLKEKVIKLVSGQPVASQNNLPADRPAANVTATSGRTITLLAPVQKLDSQPPNDDSGSRAEKTINDTTTTLQMIAPYQKADLAAQLQRQPAAGSARPESSIQELWSSALSAGSKVRNVTRSPNVALGEPRQRLISPATVDTGNSSASSGPSEALMSTSTSNPLASSTTTTTTTTTSTTATSTQKPKVSPHLKQGGSLMSAPTRQPDSAVLLSRDLPASSTQAPRSSTRPTSRQQQQQQQQPRRVQQPPRPIAASGTNSTVTGEPQKQRPTKPTIKKPKKTPAGESQGKNETLINSKGIRIVDNFLASIESSLSNRTDNQAGQRSRVESAVTMPTTIELTRSTSAFAPVRSSTQPSADTTAAPSASQRVGSTSTESPFRLATFASAPADGPSAAAGLWRPISEPQTPGRGQSGARRANMSLIVASERLPASLNAPSNQLGGSRSPFAMSAAILESPQQVSRPAGRRKLATNTYQAFSSAASSQEFESHRMSRMRLKEDSISVLGSSSSSTTTSTTTSSSLNTLEPNTRLVDDFMITTDRAEESARGSTLIPPLVGAGQRIEPIDGPRLGAGLADARQQPAPRTRGPFAFETLRAAPADEQPPSSSSRTERSPTSAAQVEARLLPRRKPALAAAADHQLEGSPPTSPPAELANEEASAAPLELDRLGNRLQAARGSPSSNGSLKCQYYGCKARGSAEFACLNYTQICDDFIDCQDESDELDCVSLLKYDSRLNRLTFSNGAGIVYLNRRGSLAPMCIDYLERPSARPSTSSAHELDADQLASAKRQQELIRQINTIGQYACSLQSFARLVSVKINHHNLVDGSNLIKNSKLFHRLSISTQEERRARSLDVSAFKSEEHEVEITTSPDCPSQRTVFVKCGSFECGQDSFSVIDQNKSAKRRSGVVINDFPWLVKLHWADELACHGYLIDESWLVASAECLVNGTRSDPDGWTAEISYEHYGNDDYQSIESNRRAVSVILTKPNESAATGNSSSGEQPESPIVLAKLEKPVRFSPLNRPICLPKQPIVNRTTAALNLALERTYRNCVTASLPLPGSILQPTQDLVLSRVEIKNCSTKDSDLNGLICAQDSSETARDDKFDGDRTHVLICSHDQITTKSRSKWTVVGVENKQAASNLNGGRRVFATVSSQLDWIVDTMNPDSQRATGLLPDLINPTNEDQSGPVSFSANLGQGQTCTMFKCSSGECLTWSRICDGLYDCSSQDDERDCHK